jgi:hypothetical protein
MRRWLLLRPIQGAPNRGQTRLLIQTRRIDALHHSTWSLLDQPLIGRETDEASGLWPCIAGDYVASHFVDG